MLSVPRRGMGARSNRNHRTVQCAFQCLDVFAIWLLPQGQLTFYCSSVDGCSSWLHCNENVFFNTLNSVTALRFRGMSLVLSLNIGSPAQMEGLITCYQRNLAGRQRFFHKCHISACVGFVCLALMRNSVVMLNVSLKMRMYEWCRAISVRSLFG